MTSPMMLIFIFYKAISAQFLHCKLTIFLFHSLSIRGYWRSIDSSPHLREVVLGLTCWRGEYAYIICLFVICCTLFNFDEFVEPLRALSGLFLCPFCTACNHFFVILLLQDALSLSYISLSSVLELAIFPKVPVSFSFWHLKNKDRYN